MPIAGVSHWRREPEFNAAQAAHGLDLIDDRLFWSPRNWVVSRETLAALEPAGRRPRRLIAAIKRRPDRPYVVGQWCNQTQGAWSYPHEAADQLLGVYTALAGDWDALVRRGIFLFPVTWGEGPAGTVGGEDIFQIAEVVNGSPHIYGLWPHAASLFLRGYQTRPETTAERPTRRAAAGKTKYRSASGWDHARGRLLLDTPYTQGVAGWIGGEPVSFATPRFRDRKPVRGPGRHLDQRRADRHDEAVTGLRHRARRADRVPLGRLLEARGRRPRPAPLPAGAGLGERSSGGTREKCGPSSSTTRRARTGEAKLETLPGGEGVSLLIDGKTAAFHWELIAE